MLETATGAHDSVTSNPSLPISALTASDGQLTTVLVVDSADGMLPLHKLRGDIVDSDSDRTGFSLRHQDGPPKLAVMPFRNADTIDLSRDATEKNSLTPLCVFIL